jgi:hypothetical protein
MNALPLNKAAEIAYGPYPARENQTANVIIRAADPAITIHPDPGYPVAFCCAA